VVPPFIEDAVNVTEVFLQIEFVEAVIVTAGETGCVTDIIIGKLVAVVEVIQERLDVTVQVIISPLFNELLV
jgi:glutamate mutase epsilon subunit